MQPEKTKKTAASSPKKAAIKKAVTSASPTEEAGSLPPVSTPKKAVVKTKKAVTAKSTEPKKAAASKTSKPKAARPAQIKVSLTFQIGYGTKFGQVLKICGDHPALGNASDDKAISLQFEDNNHWSGQINLTAGAGTTTDFSYYYLVENPDGSVDKSASYHLSIPAATKALYIRDAWNSPAFIENAFSSDVFKTLQRQATKAASAKASGSKSTSKTASHQFRVKAPALAHGQVICLTGSHEKLGKWDAGNAVLLTPDPKAGDWTTELDLADLQQPVDYKYGIYDLAGGILLSFEEGENRILAPLPLLNKGCHVQLHDGFFRTN